MDTDQNSFRPAKRVMLVESARGAAAVYVCLGHLIMVGHFAELVKWGKFIFYPLSFGQEAVYLFFFLSGFSIHYSNLSRPLESLNGTVHYYYLRLRRIYPIFLMAVGLALLLGVITSRLGIMSETPCHPEWRRLFFVFFFLSDINMGNWCMGLPNNPALWSLSYEIPYYLGYPIFWRLCKQFGIERTFLITLLFSGVFVVNSFFWTDHINNVFSLYWLWTCGAMMAEWKLKNKSFVVSSFGYYAALFFVYALGQSLEAVVLPVMHRNLKALTIGVIILSTFIKFRPAASLKRLSSAAGIVMMLFASLVLTRNVHTWGNHVFLDARLLFACAAISLLLITDKNISFLCRSLAKPFLKMGAISYAIYVIHLPILYFMGDLLRLIRAPFYLMPLALVPVFFLAWWLEIKFQGSISSALDAFYGKVMGTVKEVRCTDRGRC